MDELETTNSKGSFGRFLLTLLRLILVLVLGVVIGVAAIFLAQYYYRQATEPARVNTLRLDSMETSQASLHRQIDERLEKFNERLSALEAQTDLAVNDLAGLQASQQALEELVQQLDQNLGGLGELQTGLEADLADLRSQMDFESARIDELLLTPTPFAAGTDLERLAREVKMLKALELLSRSRLHFLNADYGLAKKDMQNAYRVLVDLQVSGLAPESDEYVEMLDRLRQAARNLPASPGVAEKDLEIAWDLVVDMLTNPLEMGSKPTPTALPIELLTPSLLTDTPTPWVTITPTVTPTPWLTPTPTPTK